MQFRLSTVFLVFVFMAAAVGAFEEWGLLIATWLLALLITIRVVRTRPFDNESLACLVLALCFLFGVPLLLPAFCRAREVARRSMCANQLKQIALALHNYHDTYGCLPPPVVRDSQGRPMHSWRVLLLPFLEHKPIYDRYDFNEPWDGPKNRALLSKMPYVYRCPSAGGPDDAPGLTNYLVVTGPGTLWPDDGSCGRFANCKDGLSRTLLVLECASSDVYWTEPRDLPLPEPDRPEASAGHVPSGHGDQTGYFVVERHAGGHLALADGSVRYSPGGLSLYGLCALACHSDGLPVGNFFPFEECMQLPVLERYVHWGHVVGFSLFATTFLILFWKALRGPLPKRPTQAAAHRPGDTNGEAAAP